MTTSTSARACVTVTRPSLSHHPIVVTDHASDSKQNQRVSLPAPTALLDSASDLERAALAHVQRDLDLNPSLSPHDRAWANPPCILRYLRAHNGDPTAATSGLLATLAWRNTNCPHRIPLTRIRSEGISGKLVAHGFSRQGMPVLYMVPRNENSTNEDLQLAYTLWTLEVCVRRMPPGVEKLVLVIDFAGMSLTNAVSPSMQRKFVSVLTSHYPERLFRAYLVNAPWFFGAIWKAISPFLDPVTKAKVVFVSGTPSPPSSSQSGSNSESDIESPASPTDSVGTGSPQSFSWGGLFGSRSKSTPVPPTVTDASTSTKAASVSQMVDELDPVDLWQEFGGQCIFRFEPDEYFAHVQALIEQVDAQTEQLVAALAAREQRVDAIPVEDET